MTKLVELFEAVSDTVELEEVGEERIVQLTKEKMVFVLGGQVQCLIKASRSRVVTLPNLENEYYKK